MKNSQEEKEKPEDLTLLSPIRGITRSIAGLTMGTAIIGFSFARIIAGTAVNTGLAIGGAIATIGALTVHLGNFARVQLTKLFNKETTANVESTKYIFNQAFKFTTGRFKAAFSTFYKVFSGERDEEIKKNLTSIVKSKEASQDDNNTPNKKQKIEELIESLPNTKEAIITAARLMMGMSQKERIAAEERKNSKKKKASISPRR